MSRTFEEYNALSNEEIMALSDEDAAEALKLAKEYLGSEALPLEIEALKAMLEAVVTATNVVLHEEVTAGRLDHGYAHELLDRMAEGAVQIVTGAYSVVTENYKSDEADADTLVVGG